VAEKWRRCDTCRKVKAVEDFEADAAMCRVCQTPVVRRAPKSAGAVTTTRVAPAAREKPAAESGAVVRTSAMSDLRGKGDPQVRARRARGRALDRLAELHAEEFEMLLADERRSEGL
jgi:hypothetical protein